MAVTKKIEEVDAIMNSFAQNSSAMPAYLKKIEKLQETVKQAEDALVKAYVGRYQEALAGKEAGTIIGKIITKLAVTDRGLEYIYGEESRTFIEQLTTWLN